MLTIRSEATQLPHKCKKTSNWVVKMGCVTMSSDDLESAKRPVLIPTSAFKWCPEKLLGMFRIHWANTLRIHQEMVRL